MFATDDPRAVLGLPAGATAAEARRAFRRLVLELHPDRHHGDPRKAARLREVVEAYETIVGARPRRRGARAGARHPGGSGDAARGAPPPPRPRFRYGCPRCDDTFSFDAACPRCEVPLVDHHGPRRAKTSEDPRVDAMLSELEQRAARGLDDERVSPRVTFATISSLLAGGALAIPIHAPIAAMMLGYGLFLIGVEALGASR